ncbi:unnamed protein product [Adineta steineri]|uniref:ADP ribosyltransferase domain-containing protein n=1 Tax=Adineta steineri TaxID=433720 RepID=A0A819P5B0_9BILA|nr:unnamed protein product [Adineta steineri]CAF0960845.1 unnamed protein product [Adineta steineri]CAF3826492.1 unnamed protein product [Adineta steineri]CAF4008298.1 unnamed protein product [Adineta steineri]
MPFRKLFTPKVRNPVVVNPAATAARTARRAQAREQRNKEFSIDSDDDVKIVYLASDPPHDVVLSVVNTIAQNNAEIFHTEESCFDFIKSVTDKKIFIIVDVAPTDDFINSLEGQSQVDSLIVYSSLAESAAADQQAQRSRVVNWCEDQESLRNTIIKSREDIDKQAAAFSIYNQKDKATRDLAKESGSFLFFQLFKIVLKNMPKTAEAKSTMVAICRTFYRGNIKELANIEEFDLTYQSEDAIEWYTRESFVYKFINKALRTEDVDVLYQFRFYIMDLSDQLELKFEQLKKTQPNLIKLYRGLNISRDEVDNFQQSTGNLISTNGYLSTSSDYSVAHGFATKGARREGLVKAIFEYQVDLNVVKKIVIADISEFSAFPEEAEVLVDIGASFQIDSCTYDETENLYRVTVQATDKGADLAFEYIEYQKKKMVDANIVLLFGHLLLEMGNYAKAEKYFDTILSSSNPNDEEVACIYFNFGRTHRLNGEFTRAVDFYTRAYNLHMDTKPRRLASAAKTLNSLGIAHSEQGDQLQAKQCFERALTLYKKSIPKKNVDYAGILVNLGTIDFDQNEYDRALDKYRKAKKIYEVVLPSGHPNLALLLVNIGNVHLKRKEHEIALIHYQEALALQQASLPSDHPDIARTLHNIATCHDLQGNTEIANGCKEQAINTVGRTLNAQHPLRSLLAQMVITKVNADAEEEVITVRL